MLGHFSVHKNALFSRFTDLYQLARKIFEKWGCFGKGWGSIFFNWHLLPNAPVNEYDVANYQCETGYRFENMTNSAVGNIVVYSEENIVFELQCLGYKTWINIYVFGSLPH